MSAYLNKMMVIGNIGEKPIIERSKTPFAAFSIATKEEWKTKEGEKQERTTWHKVKVFGGLVDVVEQYCNKGSRVYVEGKIQNNEWEDENGVKRSNQEILIDISGQLTLLDKKEN
tara:strand:- start:301 stop:645 length:345 start_codon:yes stop_codon:yes gene_type:complete